MIHRTEPNRAGRTLVLVNLLVVLGFIGSALYAQYRSEGIERRAEILTSTAMPSVHALSSARSELRHVQIELRAYLDAARAGRARSRDAVEAALAELERLVSHYRALPNLPGEQALQKDLARKLTELTSGVKTALAQADGGVAPLDILDRIGPLAQECDRHLRQLLDYNASQGERLGNEIMRLRDDAGARVRLLSVLGALVAAVATFLALQAMRRETGLLARRAHTAEQRASEFELRATELEAFAGRMAHDVLSPLGGAGLALEVARRRGGSHPDPILERGLRSLDRARLLVDDLLRFAAAEAQPPPGASAPLANTLSDVVDGMAGPAEAERVELRAESCPQCAVACAPGVLTSVLQNLIGNAIKYMGDAQKRCVTVRVWERPESVRVEVEDTGPGVPPDIPIFAPFIRAPGTGREGFGLGLATVRRLVEAHGGQVGVEAAREHGSRFWFELPKASIPARVAMLPRAHA
jgi:signal transduction histidine kinase